MTNLDKPTVDGFGKEWAAFDQTGADEAELHKIFEDYFRVFPWDAVADGAVGFDAGCGTGRWARFVAPRVSHLHCIDASDEALDVAPRQFARCTQLQLSSSVLIDKLI